ncbi:MAG: transposase [Prevotellaceae bacterium]|nr:transposase [Prevotellaceae bacterium]
MARHYCCSAKTIQRCIDRVRIDTEKTFNSVANVLMDTTYFGQSFGVMVFRDSLSGKILYRQYVKYETNALYFSGIAEIRRRGIHIQSIICDGRKGLFGLFGDIPMQMCQFHQVRTVVRYLTRKPQTDAAGELKSLTLKITKLSKSEFTEKLEAWHLKWRDHLDQRSIPSTAGKSFYTHKRLRSAYLSLKRNLPVLFTFEDYGELMIPNTTNALEGCFSDLKNKLRNHNGLYKQRKMKFIDGFFKA